MCANGKGETAIGAAVAERLERNCTSERTERLTCIDLRNGQSSQSHGAALVPQVARKLMGTVAICSSRRQLVLCETHNALAQVQIVSRQVQVHQTISFSF